MMIRLLIACASLGLLSSASPAIAQGRSLESSLNFIRDQIVSQGRIDYVANLHDSATNQSWTNQFSALASNVTVDVSGCRIGFHWFTSLDGKTVQDMDGGLPLRLASAVSVVNREQEIRSQVVEAGHPTWVATVSPAVWVVTVKTSTKSHVLDFTNQDTAERVVRAIDHVMDLCGSPKEKF